MHLPEQLDQSARACEGAALALAHALRPVATSPAPAPHVLETFQEAQAFAITCRAVMDEASPLLPLLAPDAKIVGKSPALDLHTSGPTARICNGFDTLALVLLSLFDTANVAILDVAANHSRWIVPPLQASAAFERMVTHHGQLRGLYGIMHLAGKITRHADLTETLFVNVNGKDHDAHPELEPKKWRAAIKMDDFYGREFGFHYAPEMRNVLRVVNIARGSVHKSHQADDTTPQLIKNVSMLGWGWIYSNMVLMNNLGLSIEGVSEIGADSRRDALTIQKLRKFMNLVEEPFVAGVSGFASADVAIDTFFDIPPPGKEGGIDISSMTADDSLREVFESIVDPVRIRVLSHKQRPVDLSRARARRTRAGDGGKSSSTATAKRERTVGTDERTYDDRGAVNGAPRHAANSSDGDRRRMTVETERLEMEANGNAGGRGEGGGEGGNESGKTGLTRKKSHFGGMVAEVTDQSYLASTIKTELRRLQTNVSNLLGIEEAKAASGLIMHFHGGGFVSQSSTGHAVYTREWCADIPDAVLLSVDYKLAPEHKFPTAVHECLYAYLWATRNAGRVGTLAERVVFTGDSAGGNLAIATALKAGRLGLRSADGICMAYPSLYVRMAWSPSRLLSFFDPMLPLSVLELCVKSYVPVPSADKELSEEDEALISPVLASDSDLSKLAPVAMICGSLDPLLDDVVSFAHRLRRIRQGDVLRIYEKMPHGFLNMSLVNETSRGGMRFMAKRIADFLGVALRKGSRAENPDEGGVNEVEENVDAAALDR